MNIAGSRCDDRLFLGRYCYAELFCVKHAVYTRRVHKKLLSNCKFNFQLQFVVYDLTLNFKGILLSIPTALKRVLAR